MKAVEKTREFYVNRDGGVNRKVYSRFGDGKPVVTSDFQMFPTVAEFRQRYPDVALMGASDSPDPMTYTLEGLANFVETVESVDVLMAMQSQDNRKGSVEIYHSRIQELTGLVPPPSTIEE